MFEDPPPASEAAFPNFTPTSVETEADGERLGVTLWDSEGLEKNVVDLQLKELTAFIESKFEDTFTEESKVARAPGFRDTHIHCVFMLLDPSRLDATMAADQKAKRANGARANANSFVKSRPEPNPVGLDAALDLNILRALKDKTTVVPVISKADTITAAHMAHLKRAVWASLKQAGLDSLEALDKDGGDDQSETSTEQGDQRRDLDERDEDNHLNKNRANGGIDGKDADKFSMTSVLDSPSSSESFTSADLNVAKPGKPRNGSIGSSSSSEASPASEEHLLPFSIISPDPYEPTLGGRKFPWGFADPLNPEHCDFTKLKQAVFREWQPDLREASKELWYEGWRTSRLNKKSKRNAMSLEGKVVQQRAWTGQTPTRSFSSQPWRE
ncbi:uncharacterized protein KY384_001068 [Bacidia gigantensis]|uniref:uncharacterized protein n=1 Tax=Bacidia gigantensis TaxID=2732470 RepID=UPI001D050407|nr:uncharacterized protein KY384_001068 [Bacidia gigantensis]KAG8534224.1 hypothetical protein KY384_001068 [Bacidia gigantensis]